MRMKDTLQLQTWLRSNASLDEVMRTPRFGLVDNERFTEKARKHFIFLWRWGSTRESVRHDRFYRVMGAEAYFRRIKRVRRIIEELKK